MALPGSGALSLNDIQTEFGGSNPILITEYYRGGGLVPDIAANSSVPTSGQISLSNFYNATNADYIPAAFDITTTSASGETPVSADSNQISITGINTSITLNFGTSNAAITHSGPGGSGFANVTVYVNGTAANNVTWNQVGAGSQSGLTRNMKVTVSNNANVVVGIVGTCGASGFDPAQSTADATFTVTNDSSSNTVLDSFFISMVADRS
jgi:hypothetical protein